MVVERETRQESARGARRRARLLEAAADLLTEQGFARLSHRSVAERAGVPLGATTYYFSSREDLLQQAFDRLGQRWLARATAHLEPLPRELDRHQAADAIVAVMTATSGDRDAGVNDLLVMYERYLEAGRYPALRTAVAAYDGRLAALVEEIVRRAGLSPDPTVTRLLLAVADGVMISALAHGEHETSVKEQASRFVHLAMPG